MADVYIPDGNSNNQVPAWLPYVANGNGGFGGFGGNGWGGGVLGFLFGLLCGNGGFGNGIFGGGNNANSQMLSNAQQYLMEAINHNGERATSAIQNLAGLIGQDFTQVSQAINTIQSTIATIAANQGMNTQQIINAMQLGNQAIISQFQQCCCQNQLALANMQGSINTGLQGIRGDIAAKNASDQLSNCQLRYDLTQNDNANTRAIIAKIDQVEDSRKDREIAELRAQLAKQESVNATATIVNGAISPLLGQIAALKDDVASIKRCQPPTITLPNNQYTAVPTLIANAGADFISSYWANRLTQATTQAGATTGGGTTA